MIFGAMRDKALDEVAEALFPLAHELVCTATQGSRALRPEALQELAGRGFPQAHWPIRKRWLPVGRPGQIVALVGEIVQTPAHLTRQWVP